MVFRKRGTTHIDWVISLGIFLFYIVWFFVFINPQISKSVELTPISYAIKEKLQLNAYEKIEKTPIFLKINENRTNKLIILNFTPKYGTDKFSLKDDEYYFYNNKIYLLKDYLPQNILIEITESNSTYNQSETSGDLIVKNNKVQTSKEFLTEFERTIPKKVTYKEINRINNLKIKLEEAEITPKNETNITTGLFHQEKLESQRINVSTTIFAKNSIIFLSTEKNDIRLNKRVNISMEINNFDNYFIDTEEFGEVILNTSKCKEKKGNYLKFYDETNSLNFILPDQTDIKICFNENNVGLTLLNPNSKINDIYLIFDNSSYTNSNFLDYTYTQGVNDESEVLSLKKLNNLDYDNLKNELGLPDERDFQITVWNNTLSEIIRDKKLFELGLEKTSSDNVYVNEYSDYINLDSGIKNKITVGIKVW